MGYSTLSRVIFLIAVGMSSLLNANADDVEDARILTLFQARFDAARVPRKETLAEDLALGRVWSCYTIGKISERQTGNYHGPKNRYKFVSLDSTLPFLPFEVRAEEVGDEFINQINRSFETNSFNLSASELTGAVFDVDNRSVTTQVRITDGGDLVVKLFAPADWNGEYIRPERSHGQKRHRSSVPRRSRRPEVTRYNYCPRESTPSDKARRLGSLSSELVPPPSYEATASNAQ